MSIAFVFLPPILTPTRNPSAFDCPYFQDRNAVAHSTPLIHNPLAKGSPSLPSPITATINLHRPSARRSSYFVLHRPASCLKCCRFLKTYTRQRTEHNLNRNRRHKTQQGEKKEYKGKMEQWKGIRSKKERCVPQATISNISPAGGRISQRPPHPHTSRRSTPISFRSRFGLNEAPQQGQGQ